MSILHTTGKLIAYGLLIASLALPSVVSAEEQTKSSGELAPGFNICEKSAADTAKNSAEYRVAMSVCLNLAEKYWEGVIKKENQENMDMYADVSNSEYAQKAVIDFQKAWLQYKEAGSDLVRSDGDPMTTIRARYFEVQETRRQAKLLTNLLEFEIHEEPAPGYNMCMEDAGRSGNMPELRADQSDCREAAHQYLDPILEKNYELYMNLYKDSPEKQKKLQNFQKAWEQYAKAGCELIHADGGTMAPGRAANFYLNEEGRQARILETSGPRW